MDFHSLTRRELQTLCKKNGIPANITNVAMADALRALKIVQGFDEFAACSETQTAQSSIESPEKSEVTSPYVPRTRSVRKKAVNDTLPKQSLSRTRRSTRISTGQHADQKPSIAPVNIEVQFSEAELMASGTRKLGTARESTARRMYGTRRSTRLAGKASEDSKMEGKEIFDTANVELFPADCGDNFEATIEECNKDVTQSTVSQSEAAEIIEEGLEISNYAKMTSDNSGFGIPNAKEEVKTNMTNEEDGVQENGLNEVNTEICFETHEETGLSVEGFDKQPETNVNKEVAGENEEFGGEGDYQTGNGEMLNGDGPLNDETVAPGTCSNILENIGLSGDNFDKLPEMVTNNEVNGETEDFGEDQDKVNGDKEMVKSDATYEVVVNVIPGKDGGNLVSEIGCKIPEETGSCDVLDKQPEIESKDGVIGETGECSDVTNPAILDAFVTKSMEGEADIVTDAEKGELEDDEMSSFCDNLPEAPMTTEEAHVEITNSTTTAYPKAAVEHIIPVDESKDDTEAAGEEFQAFSVSDDDKAAKLKLEQLNEVDYPKEGQENSGGEDASEIEIGASCLPRQMIFADEGVIPATAPTPGKKKSVSTNASLGKENVSEHSWFAKEEHQSHINCNLTDWSLRKLRKEVKQLTILNNGKDNKGNPVKLDELETVSRPALQMLPENQI